MVPKGLDDAVFLGGLDDEQWCGGAHEGRQILQFRHAHSLAGMRGAAAAL